jgi:hypothetical protein
VHQSKTNAASDDLEIWILRQLEWLRVVSRTAPMLGLVATMIPMGPALLALTRNDALRFQTNGSIGEGEGIRAGITYRLPNGRMIYVPEGKDDMR